MVPGTDLTADLVRQLQFLKHPEVNSLLASVWGTVRETAADKLAMIAEYKELVALDPHPEADAEFGRAVFARTCMKCHILYGAGNRIGPDLTGSNRSNLDYLLKQHRGPECRDGERISRHDCRDRKRSRRHRAG
jgi:mono/diheme cytochrome c family protein